MIEFRMCNSDELWKVLGIIVHKEDLYHLCGLWFAHGYEFRIGDTVYQEFNDDFKAALMWARLQKTEPTE